MQSRTPLHVMRPGQWSAAQVINHGSCMNAQNISCTNAQNISCMNAQNTNACSLIVQMHKMPVAQTLNFGQMRT